MGADQAVAYVAALLRERASMVQYARADRVGAIDDELRRVGAEVPGVRVAPVDDTPKPVKRTTNRRG